LGAEREGEGGGLAAGVEALGTLGVGGGVRGGGVGEGGGVGWGWWWVVGEGAGWGGRFAACVESLRLSGGGRGRAGVVVAWAEGFLVAVGAGAVVVGEVQGAHGWGDGQAADAAVFAEAAEGGARGGAAVR